MVNLPVASELQARGHKAQCWRGGEGKEVSVTLLSSSQGVFLLEQIKERELLSPALWEAGGSLMSRHAIF